MSSSVGRGSHPHYSEGDGDWICPDSQCGNKNYARRKNCNRCGKEKPSSISGGHVKSGGIEIGKQIAEKSKGLFSADDWQCKTCGNVNWARRSQCNVCNTPRIGKVEERTGFGGGFMEREENVAYKDRNSDDEEFDEFGRKKKKYRADAQSMASKTEPGDDEEESESSDDKDSEDEDSEDEDSDDEDSDEEDLSKYQFGSDEDDGENASSKEQQQGERREDEKKGRTRSRSPDSKRDRSRSPL